METKKDSAVENISIENATYLQNVETNTENKNEDSTPNFEVDSIELTTPQLFSEDQELNISNNPKIEEKNEAMESQDNSQSGTITEPQEPQMFEDSENDEDLEIPAFLRRQKN